MGNKKFTDNEMIEAYEKTGSVWRAAELLGCCGQSVHERLTKIGGVLTGCNWTKSEIEFLKNNYEKYASTHNLDSLSDKMGKHKTNICRKAKEYNLTNDSRAMPDKTKNKCSEKITEWHKNNEHPKGFKGMSHSYSAKKLISINSKNIWENMSEKEKSDHILKQLKGREKSGSLYNNSRKTSWKQGWRNIGGEEKYYRSRWEANYARYLELLKNNGDIKEWEHEPKTFWFEKIKRGTRSYLPDFRVTNNDGSITYHEVKGWMDQRSKTKLKRMKKYHPDVDLIVIRKKQYNDIKKKLSGAIKGWE